MLSSLLVLALAQSGAGRPEQEVFLHIESNRPGLELARVTSVGTGAVATSRGVAYVSMINMTKECAAPCDRLLARPEDTFMVGGPGATTSDAFTLAGRGESVTLKVNAGSAGLRATGFWLMSLGISSALVGGLLFGLSGGFSGVPNPYGRGFVGDMGYWGLIGGGVALAGGIPLFAFNGTHVEFLPGPGGLGTVRHREEQRKPAPGETVL